MISQSLKSNYSEFLVLDTESNYIKNIATETNHWLENYPSSSTLYHKALSKYKDNTNERNLLDDLRLALELLLKDILDNKKSLENQIDSIGKFVQEKGGSPEFTNMFKKLIDYYCYYNNEHIKHNDSVIKEEIEFMLEITSAFMKQLICLSIIE